MFPLRRSVYVPFSLRKRIDSKKALQTSNEYVAWVTDYRNVLEVLRFQIVYWVGFISEINVMDVESSYPRLFSNKIGKLQSEPIKLHIEKV